METNKKNEQSQSTEQKLIFLNMKRFFFSKKGKLILVCDGNTAVALDANFIKLLRGTDYTPAPRKEKAEDAMESQVA